MNFEGKKTYLVAAASLVYAGLGLYLGHMNADQAFQIVQTSVIGMTLRAGIAKNR